MTLARTWLSFSTSPGGPTISFVARPNSVQTSLRVGTQSIERTNPDYDALTVANRVIGKVEGRTCILVDDMIDSGGTICHAAEALMKDGASGVVIAATHAILSGPAKERLEACAAQEVIVTNTLPIAPEMQFEGLTTLSIAPLISRAVREVFEDGSVTSMFEGNA